MGKPINNRKDVMIVFPLMAKAVYALADLICVETLGEHI
jgi:hypothetical protein